MPSPPIGGRMSVLQYGNQKRPHTNILDSPTDSQGQRILRLLAAESQAVPARELAEKLLTADETRPIDDLSEESIERVEVRLQHVHLPRLAEAGLVDWDRIERRLPGQ